MKKNRIIPILIFTTVFILGFASCKSKDVEIQERVEQQISSHPEAENVEIVVSNQKVTLNGEVSSRDATYSLIGLDISAKGVKSVINNLTTINTLIYDESIKKTLK